MPATQAPAVELSVNALQVAECYAVIFPERPARSKALKWINTARKANAGTRGMTSEELRSAIDELVAAELLLPSVEAEQGVAARGPAAVFGTLTRFCESAVESGSARIVLDGLDRETERYQYSYRDPRALPDNLEQRVRVALISADFAQYADLTLPGSIWLWLTEPRASIYLERLPEPERSRACQFGLSWLTEYLLPIDVFARTCESLAPAPGWYLHHARALIFQGKFDAALEQAEHARSRAPDDKPLQVEIRAMQAMILTLQGDDEGAMRAIEATLEAERSGTRKRIVFVDSLCFCVALLSLVRLGAAQARETFNVLLESRRKLKLESEVDRLFLAAEEAELPDTGLGPLFLNAPPEVLSVLFAIASRWHTDYHLPAKPAAYRLWIERLVRQAEAGGYAWMVAELQCVAEASFGPDAPHADDIKRVFASRSVAARRKTLGMTTLTHLVHAIETWEYSLRELEQLASRASRPKARAETSKVSTRRLTWQVLGVWGGTVSVAPIEQSLGKNGQWSAGRKVALKRLREQTGSMPHLIEQDVKAAGSIQKQAAYGWGGGSPSYETTVRTVFQLVGHPHVYDEDGLRLDVVERLPELRLEEQDDHVLLSFEPVFEGASYRAVLDRDRQRVQVTFFTAAQQRIHATLPPTGLRVPGEARERLQALAADIAGDISVQGSADAANTTLQPGNPEPLLALEPLGAGLRVRLRVEPLAGSNVFFDVGTGGTVVYVPGANGTVSIQRDLAQEQALLSERVLQSAVMSQHYDGRPHFELDDVAEALELLEQVQQAGVRCIWPSEIPFRIKARADMGRVSLDIRSAREWFAASGSLALDDAGDDTLALEKLLELMGKRPDSRFVDLGKGEFLALSRTLHQQLSTLQAFASPARGTSTDQQIHPLAAVALAPLLGEATVKAAKSWTQLRRRVTAAFTQVPEVPAALEAELRNYQQDGFVWLARLGEIGAGACLADDMGLGKTVQALALLQHRASGGPALVVAPTSVAGNWLQEAQRFSPTLTVKNYAQAADERQGLLDELGGFDVVVISYGLLLNDIEALKAVHWHTVVLDEAQAIKNAATGRAKAARQLTADFRIVTTGTPVQNNLMDLHSLFSFLNPQLLGSEAVFRKRFALPISRETDPSVRDQAREQLQQLVSPFMLRRQKREVLRELPARTELQLAVRLSPEEAGLYETVRREALASLEADDAVENAGQQKMIILSYLTRLRRLCCNPALIAPDWQGPMSKLAVFAETLAELIASGHKALVFSQFVDHLKIVERHLKEEGIAYQYLDGSTPAKKRTERVNAFQSGAGDVFLISLTAGGTGLNLTAADYVIHLDPWWNPAVEDQASDRAHRLGQQRPVTIVRMVTTGTIEEQIQLLHGTKRDLADSVLAGTDAPSLDAERMMQLLQAVPGGGTSSTR